MSWGTTAWGLGVLGQHFSIYKYLEAYWTKEYSVDVGGKDI